MEIGYRQLQVLGRGERRRKGIRATVRRCAFWIYAAAVLGAAGFVLAAMTCMVIF